LAGLHWSEFAIQNKSQYCRASILISGFDPGAGRDPEPSGELTTISHEMDVT
jgi:hypothetical protein